MLTLPCNAGPACHKKNLGKAHARNCPCPSSYTGMQIKFSGHQDFDIKVSWKF